MLRYELGKADFEESLRIFWRQHRFRTAGWDDLRRSFEQTSGRSLGWFFAQWLNRPGAPQIEITEAHVEPAGGRYWMSLAVTQNPADYRLSLPVVIKTKDGREVRETMLVTGAQTRATWLVDARPTAISVDPGYDVFRRLLPGEGAPILRDVTLSAEAVTVIATKDAEVQRTARDLASRLLDAPGRVATSQERIPEAAPMLIIGLTDDVEATLELAKLEARRESGQSAAREVDRSSWLPPMTRQHSPRCSTRCRTMGARAISCSRDAVPSILANGR